MYECFEVDSKEPLAWLLPDKRFSSGDVGSYYYYYFYY